MEWMDSKTMKNEDMSTKNETESELELLKTFIDETNLRLKAKFEIRQQNLNCIYPAETHFSKLDSSLKKNTTFVKKLKSFTANQLDILLKDICGLNLTKYISEVAAALVECKLKMTDISAGVRMCSVLHQTYSDFSQSLFDNWQKILSIKQNDKISNPSKLRVDLRFYAELVNAGIFSNKTGLPLLGNVLMALINMDKEEHNNVSIIMSFCRHCGEDYAGLVPSKIRELSEKYKAEIPRSTVLPIDKQNNVRSLLRDYYASLTKHLTNEHLNLQVMERQNKRILQTKGELNQDRKDKMEALQAGYDKLYSATVQFSELLDLPIPDLPIEKVTSENEGGVTEGVIEPSMVTMEPWEDDETKAFYEELPDLQQYLPNYCVKEKQETPSSAMSADVLDSDNPELLFTEDNQVLEALEPEIEEVTPTNTKQMLESFLVNLPNCVNREMIDSAAIDFLLNLNNKHSRKKLARNLFGVSRTRLDLLPFYARLAATISLVSNDVGNELSQMLKQDFKYHVRKKDQINIESKIKVVRYIGEMVKFGLYSKIEALFCLKILLLDFQHHHIEMACAFLEVCGRYLYNNSESRQRIQIYLEQIMRIKTVSVLDSRHVAQIESVYYLIKPPENTGIIQKVRLPIHQFIRNLIFQELNKTNIDKVLKLLRKIDWDEPNIANYAIKCLSMAYNLRYHLIRSLADLVSALNSHQEKPVTKVVDAVFEDIRTGLESHSLKLSQRRIAMAKYLGELYNYRLVETSELLKTLYSIISFGVSTDHTVVSEVDPPNSLFRLKLACVLLETCGQYFSSAVSRRRLDYFLIFFQNYYWFKKSDPIWEVEQFPVLFDHQYKDTLTLVRPKLTPLSSYDDSKDALESLRQSLYPDLEEGKTNDDGTDLKTIVEYEEHTEGELEDDTEEALSPQDSDAETRHRDEGDLTEDLSDNEDGQDRDDVQVKLLDTIPRDSEEDRLFQQALDKMMTENCQERLKENVKLRQEDIAVPLLARSNKKNYEQLNDNAVATDDKNEVPFVLMIRKGTKQQYKSFNAPMDSQLAMNLKSREREIKEEKEKVKRLTLNITERLEEEDYQEMLAANVRSVTPSHNTNRERRVTRFKHQKGAPDADLIFGNK